MDDEDMTEEAYGDYSDESDNDVEYSEEEDADFALAREDSCDQKKLRRQSDMTVLTPDMISKKMFDIVNDVNTVFQLATPHVRILLTTCKWDKEKLLERYYAGDQEALFQEAHLIHPRTRPVNPTPRLQAQSTASCGAAASPEEEFICDICMLAFPEKEMHGLECGHLFCAECWDSYLTVMVMNEGRAQTIFCPSSTCDIVVDETTVLDLLKDSEVRQKYLLLITNSFVIDHPLLRWCPGPGCPNALHSSNSDLVPVKCSCGHAFCFKCGRDPHEPILCEFLRKWLKKCDDDSETCNWIHVNTKECPKCRATIEKSGGCNHMICRNHSCKAEFCWMCLGPWDRHGTSWYKCNQYNEKEAKQARDSQQSSRAALERYLFYCNRYMNHQRSRQMEKKLYEMIHGKMLELQDFGLSWVEVQFMKKAVDSLCHCRQTLQYTYAFAFYLKKNNQTYIFEDNQGDLEMATERLSEYLERELSLSSLSDLKISVQDKTKYCDARCQVLLDHVYEGYENDLWEFID